MKKCTKCEIEKDESLFNKKYGKPQSVCKGCHSEYRKSHYEQNRQKYIDKASRNRDAYREEYYAWLATKSCVDCGISDIRVLEQDHLEDKTYGISTKVGSVPLSTLLEELAKCEVVCANCHRIRTIERGNWIKGVI